MSEDTILYAREYIKRGWHVLPVDGKVPLTKNGLKDASNDINDAELWWGIAGKLKDSNIAIRTGSVSKLIVVDVDAKSGGLESYEKMKDQFPPTPRVRTGGGGFHLYYLHTGQEVKNSASKIAPGIDIRGDNGYVVAPPSSHESGNDYSWEVLPSTTPLAPFPIEVLPKDTTFKAGDLYATGKRNPTTTQLVGHLKRLGVPDDATRAAVLAIDNGLSDDEKMGIVNHSSKWLLPLPPRTEIGQAELIKALFSDHIAYDNVRKTWMVWGTHHWDTTDSVYTYIKEAARYVGQRAANYASVAKTPEEKKEAEELTVWAYKLESSRAVAAVTTLLEYELAKKYELDAAPYLLGVPNGVVNLVDGSLMAGAPTQWITRSTATLYNPTALCPRWEQFINEIFRDRDGSDRPNLVDWIHRAVGYSITGDVSRQCWFLCLGEGGNGKGTFLGTLQDILGTYAQKLSIKSITVRANRRGIDNDIADLAGARFLLSGEAGTNAELDSERIKDLVGSDSTIRASRMYKEDFEFTMVAKIWMPNNHRPKVTDDSVGFWRRVRFVGFDQKFPIDPTLKTILDGEKEGILAWCIRGAAEYLQRGLEPPDEVIQLTADFQRSSDPLIGWFEESCIAEIGAELRAKVVYPSYIDWCGENEIGERERIGRRKVADYLAMKFGRKHDANGNFFPGVRLKSDEPTIPVNEGTDASDGSTVEIHKGETSESPEAESLPSLSIS